MKNIAPLMLIAATLAIAIDVTTAGTVAPVNASMNTSRRALPAEPEVSVARFASLRHGINLSHWYAQAIRGDYSRTHLETHTTTADIALIRKMGFDHVRLTVEPAPLFHPTAPDTLDATYLGYLDTTINMILDHGLAIIIDIHPTDEFKLKLNTDNKHVEAFAAFWQALAQHLSARDPEHVFLEVLNEPMVEDPYRWAGIQLKLIAAIRRGAPRHTIIAAGHRWSGPDELMSLEPVGDGNVIYNFHFYEPMQFTHQGATWAGPYLSLLKGVPYPANSDSLASLLSSLSDPGPRMQLEKYAQGNWNASRIEQEMAKVAAWAQAHQVRVTCNEFGVYRQFAPAASRAAWIHDVRAALEKYGIGWTMWDYAGGFAVVDKTNGRAAPNERTLTALGLKLANNDSKGSGRRTSGDFKRKPTL